MGSTILIIIMGMVPLINVVTTLERVCCATTRGIVLSRNGLTLHVIKNMEWVGWGGVGEWQT